MRQQFVDALLLLIKEIDFDFGHLHSLAVGPFKRNVLRHFWLVKPMACYLWFLR